MERLAQETHEFNVIFIHSALDEVGLTANEFRILAHLARRANDQARAWPGIDSMAKICRMHKETVIECIRTLESYGMIVVDRKPGKGSIYYLTGPSKWKLSEMGNGPTSRNGGTPPVGNGERYQSERGNVSISNEVNPEKVIQLPQAPASPSASLNGPSSIESKTTPSNPLALRIGACIGRSATTAWSEKEIKSFKALAKKGVAEEDLVAVEIYYKVNRKLERNICRRDLYTLLNNFPGEVDRAKAWADQRSGREHKKQTTRTHEQDDETF